MSKKAVALVGSYRHGGITEQAVDAVLEALEQKGCAARKIRLGDQHIEFCTNCRACAADSAEKKRGSCVHGDNMDDILSYVDFADMLVIASPVISAVSPP